MAAADATLPLLPLPYPLILLPAATLTLAVDRPTALAVRDLVRDAESDDARRPLLAAVPLPAGHARAHATPEWATAARVVRLTAVPAPRRPSQAFLLSLQGLVRVRLLAPPPVEPLRLVDGAVSYAHAGDDEPAPEAVQSFRAAALRLLDRLTKDAAQPLKRQVWRKLAQAVEDAPPAKAANVADFLISAVDVEYEEKLAYLATSGAAERLDAATRLLVKHASISEVTEKIATDVNASLSKQQKEFFLRQQLSAIQKELQALHAPDAAPARATPGLDAASAAGRAPASELDADDDQQDADELADLKRKIEAMERGSEERKMCVREWRRMKRIQPTSVEHSVIRSYLEWVTAVPWPSTTTANAIATLKDPAFLTKARAQLDEDHFGLDKIKRRLIEYLAIVRLKHLAAAEADVVAVHDAVAADPVPAVVDGGPDVALPVRVPTRKPRVKGPILLFCGPPGVGKTSMGLSVARALGRPFQRISLGGVRDEAEIRGHRRTYVASGPGVIVQAMRKAGRPDPVILLDEIDKLGRGSIHGDPEAALLEVLDPEQNHSFTDHYINLPLDLSQVLFICTSNTLDTISPPLLDRCEVIQLSGYTHDEKLRIARQFLLPKQLRENSLDSSRVEATEDALLRVVTHYTAEAGVRSLERSVGAVVRHKALQWAEYQDGLQQEGGDGLHYQPLVEAADLEGILGIPRWNDEDFEREARAGLVYGLVVSGLGEGAVLPVETSLVPGSGQLKLTGSLGDVIKESGVLALSWVKAHAYQLGITTSSSLDPLKSPNLVDIHLHLPAGGQKKDGPSAGIAMTCALVSLLTGNTIPANVAMTGEITLRGRVAPVGGIKEKVLGAHRARVTKVILPWANRKDVEHDVAIEIRNNMQFIFVRSMDEVLDAAFGKGKLRWRNAAPRVESRL